MRNSKKEFDFSSQHGGLNTARPGDHYRTLSHLGQSSRSDYRVDQSELSAVEENRPIRPYIRTKRLLDRRADSQDVGSPGGEAGAGDLPFLPYKTQPVAQFDPFQQPIQSQRQMKELNYDGEKFYYRVFRKAESRRHTYTAGPEVQRVHFESNERAEVKEIEERAKVKAVNEHEADQSRNLEGEAERPSMGGTSDKLYAFLYNQIRRPVINQLCRQGRTLELGNQSVFH